MSQASWKFPARKCSSAFLAFAEIFSASRPSLSSRASSARRCCSSTPAPIGHGLPRGYRCRRRDPLDATGAPPAQPLRRAPARRAAPASTIAATALRKGTPLLARGIADLVAPLLVGRLESLLPTILAEDAGRFHAALEAAVQLLERLTLPGLHEHAGLLPRGGTFPLAGGRFCDDSDQPIDVERLHKRFGYPPCSDRLTHLGLSGLGRDDDHGLVLPGLFLTQEIQQFEPRNPGQLDIQHQHVNPHLLEGRTGGCGITRYRCAPAVDIIEQALEEIANTGVILDSEDRQRGLLGFGHSVNPHPVSQPREGPS